MHFFRPFSILDESMATMLGKCDPKIAKPHMMVSQMVIHIPWYDPNP